MRRLRSYEVESRVLAGPVRTTEAAGSPGDRHARRAWRANEEIVRARPVIASRLRLAIVHHTAGTNDYTRAQSAAIVRGIELYHVLGNGWNDIGYNFLVDRFGTVYEGRGGGIDRNVVGAHAQGFNVGTVGVALIGNFESDDSDGGAAETRSCGCSPGVSTSRTSIRRPRSLYTSGGNYKFRAGRVVTLRAISGHRDTGPTECPGARAYALLPALTRRVAATGLPKLYGPEVIGVIGGPVRFRAQLSSALPWTVTVTDRSGATVASGAGRGSLVDWTWSSAGARAGPFTWTIAAPGVRPARAGSARRPSRCRLRRSASAGLRALPAVLAPAADGSGATANVTFTLGAPAHGERRSSRTPPGRPWRRVLASPSGPRAERVLVVGRRRSPDGRYRLVVTATAVGRSVREGRRRASSTGR